MERNKFVVGNVEGELKIFNEAGHEYFLFKENYPGNLRSRNIYTVDYSAKEKIAGGGPDLIIKIYDSEKK